MTAPSREMHARNVSLSGRRSLWPFNGSPSFSGRAGN